MLRTVYFVCALLCAAIGTLSTFIGFGTMVHHMTIGGKTLEQAIHGGSTMAMIISSVGILGWIAFSYLFVVEDDRIENNSGNPP